MNDHEFGSIHGRPTAEQVEFFAREMRTRAWSQHVFIPLRRLARRIAEKLIPRAIRNRALDENALPDATARR